MATDAVRAKVSEVIRDAVLAAHPGTAIAYDNVKFTQPKGTPWIHIAFAPNKSMRKDIGATRVFRHMGVVVVNIMTAEDTGTKTAIEIADTVFRAVADRKYNLGADGFLSLCFAEQRNRGVLNGWYTRNVQVEYHQDVEGDA